MAAGDLIQKIPAHRLSRAGAQALTELVAREAPLEIRLNGRSHTLVMVNPGNLEDLARGFCLSEGLVQRPDQVQGIAIHQGEVEGVGLVYWAEVTLPEDLARAAKVRRVAPAATSCGLCGLESVGQLARGVAPVGGDDLRVEAKALGTLADTMTRNQPIYVQTGGAHAALLATPAGEVLAVAEDVGRHNALDKALGAAIRAGAQLGGLVGILSGRISYEMALKAARAGLPLLGSVSAPTALGIQLAQGLGITLVGFIRDGRATVYTHPQRVLARGEALP